MFRHSTKMQANGQYKELGKADLYRNEQLKAFPGLYHLWLHEGRLYTWMLPNQQEKLPLH